MSANTAAAPDADPKMAAEAAPSVPVAVEVNQSVPPVHNPEALEDAPRAAPGAPASEARFQNVDLEAGNVGTTAQVPTSSKPESPLEKSALTEMAQNMDWGVLNLLLAASSIVVMIASATICGGSVIVASTAAPGSAKCSGIQGYQVAVSTISAAIALVTAFLHHSGKLTDAKVLELISVFQFLWWTAGMIVLTFFGDYQTISYGNGYFGTWLAFFFAAAALINVSQLFQQTVNRAVTSVRSPLLFLIMASAVAMGASIAPCSSTAPCRDYEAFAVALSVISLFISIILMLIADRLSHSALRGIALFLVLWWSVGFCIVTFKSPWIAPGNGYFASLGAVFASVAFLRVVLAHA